MGGGHQRRSTRSHHQKPCQLSGHVEEGKSVLTRSIDSSFDDEREIDGEDGKEKASSKIDCHSSNYLEIFDECLLFLCHLPVNS